MDKQSKQNSSRDLVLNAAEELFVARGYETVTLKDIAKILGIKQASLYYHFPGGKEDLYVEVMLRHLERRKIALEKLASDGDLKDCLFRVGVWLIKQPPLYGGRMILADLPQLPVEKATELEQAFYRCAFAPIESMFARYQDYINADPGFIGGTFLSSLESLYTVKRYGSESDEQLVVKLIDLLLNGALKT